MRMMFVTARQMNMAPQIEAKARIAWRAAEPGTLAASASCTYVPRVMAPAIHQMAAKTSNISSKKRPMPQQSRVKHCRMDQGRSLRTRTKSGTVQGRGRSNILSSPDVQPQHAGIESVLLSSTNGCAIWRTAEHLHN